MVSATSAPARTIPTPGQVKSTKQSTSHSCRRRADDVPSRTRLVSRSRACKAKHSLFGKVLPTLIRAMQDLDTTEQSRARLDDYDIEIVKEIIQLGKEGKRFALGDLTS